MLGLLVVVYKIPYSSCIGARHNGVCLSYCCLPGIWYTVVACHIFLMVSPNIVDIRSEYFVYWSCVYIIICYIYARLVVPRYLLFCCIYINGDHMLSKTRSSGRTRRVIGEVLVLGLLVVVYKIPYSSWTRYV